MESYAKDMNTLAKSNEPFTEDELDDIIHGLTDLLFPLSSSSSLSSSEENKEDREVVLPDLTAIRSLLAEVGHLDSSDWDRTSESALRLANLLHPRVGNHKEEEEEDEVGELSPVFRTMFDRILTEGKWDNAAQHSKNKKDGNDKPWVVLVTGLNGIRKSTSVYQPWFEHVLRESMVAPPSTTTTTTTETLTLPTGNNSFFRQLDHMIATLVHRRFRKLYYLTSLSHDFTNDNHHTSEESSPPSPPSTRVVNAYSAVKAALFTRYRTLSEILGVLLVREAQTEQLNVMVETSGRSVAMFQYVDDFFPSEMYRKLVLRFTIDELGCAEESVDVRMVKEMRNGYEVLKKYLIISSSS